MARARRPGDIAPHRIAVLALVLGACGGDPGDDGGDGGDDDGAESVCGDGEVTGAEGCDDGANVGLTGGCMPGCQVVDGSDALFARDLLDIEIEIPDAEWDLLRHEHKTRHSVLGDADCLSAPVASPYNWYAASVTIDGEHFDDIGLRKKGLLGSQSTLKPSLKLDFDRFVEGQNLLGLKRLGLNNSKADPTFARTCLAYGIFAAAGVPASRCTFARVTLNGAVLGVYVVIEEVGKPFLARRTADAEGNLYEGTVSDFRAGFDRTFEQETNKDSDPSHDDLAAVADVLDHAADVELLAALEPLVDLDAYYAFWAAESLVWHTDGYDGNTNNFYVYADPAIGGRLRFIPWGPDGTFRRDTRPTVPDSVLAFGALGNRLYALPDGRVRFYREMTRLLDTVWSPPRLGGEAERISSIVRPDLDEALVVAHDAAVADLIAIIDERRDVIGAATAAGPPDWTDGMRDDFCRVPIGAISGSFATTWGTLAADIFASGSGGLVLTLDGAPIEVTKVGSRAGYDAVVGRGRLQMTVELAGDKRLAITFTFPDERWFEPFMVVGTHALISPPFNVSMVEQDLTTSPVTTLRRFEIGEGSWTFDAIGAGPGEVRGSFSATAYLVP